MEGENPSERFLGPKKDLRPRNVIGTWRLLRSSKEDRAEHQLGIAGIESTHSIFASSLSECPAKRLDSSTQGACLFSSKNLSLPSEFSIVLFCRQQVI